MLTLTNCLFAIVASFQAARSVSGAGAQDHCVTDACIKPVRDHSLMQREAKTTRAELTFLARRARLATALPDQKGQVFIGIKSAPKSEYRSRRDHLRSSGCLKSIKDAGFSYAFVMGVPMSSGHDLTGHDQGGRDTPEERKNEEALLKEIEEHGDILMLSMRDQYADLTDKLIGVFDFGVHHTNAQYIMEVDDDKCVVPSVLKEIIDNHRNSNKKSELWAGAYLFNGKEYESMKGPTGITAPYFSGNGCMLSRNLARTLIEDDHDHTMLFGIYGTTMDDANLGKWVKFAQEKHHVHVRFVQDSRMLREP
eukprot:TRINITY_DN4546_c0_g1_i1.p1 TRINITY_DN4546_c0_g1~~TRINITY_DN4546_c0_g1_i1.p1  ORF type:complete len:309 (+),score=47.85 TRINITY_DN4546_c0_g1_i1:69-995(+)